jgi:hypothetical protein
MPNWPFSSPNRDTLLLLLLLFCYPSDPLAEPGECLAGLCTDTHNVHRVGFSILSSCVAEEVGGTIFSQLYIGSRAHPPPGVRVSFRVSKLITVMMVPKKFK